MTAPKYSPEFKVKIVLEALRGEKTMAQLCREHHLGHDLLSRWRQDFLARAPQLFTVPARRSPEEERIAELERLVGQLTLELAAAKKASALPGSRSLNGGRS
jgi:transposase-like protein